MNFIRLLGVSELEIGNEITTCLHKSCIYESARGCKVSEQIKFEEKKTYIHIYRIREKFVMSSIRVNQLDLLTPQVPGYASVSAWRARASASLTPKYAMFGREFFS
jgi:hypothetical protein